MIKNIDPLLSNNSKYNGTIIEAIIEDSDEYLEIKKVTNQDITKIKPYIKLIAKSIPTYVATPLPPLNLSHTGNTCPKKTLNEAI